MTHLEKARQEIDAIDKEMAQLFERRMDAVRSVAAYKKQNGLPIEDAAREAAVVCKNAAFIREEEYRPYYERFLRYTMELSKDMQREKLSGG